MSCTNPCHSAFGETNDVKSAFGETNDVKSEIFSRLYTIMHQLTVCLRKYALILLIRTSLERKYSILSFAVNTSILTKNTIVYADKFRGDNSGLNFTKVEN